MFKVFSIFIVLLVSSNCMKWEQWSVDKSEIPKNAVQAGTENGESVYVIRARHADGLYPGKFMPEIKKAFVTYNRKDIPIKKFELLTGDKEITWSDDPKDGRKLVRGGYSVKGDNLHICRIAIAGNQIPGRLQDKICYISFRGFEKQRKEFETLKFS